MDPYENLIPLARLADFPLVPPVELLEPGTPLQNAACEVAASLVLRAALNGTNGLIPETDWPSREQDLVQWTLDYGLQTRVRLQDYPEWREGADFSEMAAAAYIPVREGVLAELRQKLNFTPN